MPGLWATLYLAQEMGAGLGSGGLLFGCLPKEALGLSPHAFAAANARSRPSRWPMILAGYAFGRQPASSGSWIAASDTFFSSGTHCRI